MTTNPGEIDPRALYARSVGDLPPSIALAMDTIPDQLQAYLHLRNTVHETGPLPKDILSLLMSVLDVATGNYDGALSHGRAALKNGLPLEGLLQAYTVMWLIQGFASTWGNVGWRVIAQLRDEVAVEGTD
jgi:alkylhydroperoxidase/carboxymuconolactone decarboxylase family protein YurZ